LPASQASQADEPSPDACVPTAHAVQDEAASAEYFPELQSLHDADAEIAPYFPAGQSVQLAAAAALYVPLLHVLQAVLAVPAA
jgi:hypothetical protein